MPTVEEATQMRGMTAVDRDDDKIGKIKDVYPRSGHPPAGMAGDQRGLLSSGVNFVPLAQATREGDNVRVPFEKGHVKDAPHAEADGALSQEEEARLYQHYGMDYGESRSDDGLPEGGTAGVTEGAESRTGTAGRGTVGRDTSGPETDEAMTRSEEELRVGTQRMDASATSHSRRAFLSMRRDSRVKIPVAGASRAKR